MPVVISRKFRPGQRIYYTIPTTDPSGRRYYGVVMPYDEGKTWADRMKLDWRTPIVMACWDSDGQPGWIEEEMVHLDQVIPEEHTTGALFRVVRSDGGTWEQRVDRPDDPARVVELCLGPQAKALSAGSLVRCSWTEDDREFFAHCLRID